MPVVEMSYPISGDRLPADNGYPLYSAVTRHLGRHLPREISLASVGGSPCGSSRIAISQRSHLRLRTPCEMIAEILPLAGATLHVDGYQIVLGVPRVQTLRPSPDLGSRLVSIKGYTEAEPFLKSAEQQLRRICGSGEVCIPLVRRGGQSGTPQRRVLRIKGCTIVGFAVQVRGLRPEDAERLLIHGIGGRRHMGCGIFVPTNEGEVPW